MPWKETGPMDQRVRFVAAVSDGGLGMTEACQLFGISRKSGYKWLERYRKRGPAGLQDTSRAPKSVPWALGAEMAKILLAVREAHPTWGPRKILDHLTLKRPELDLPAASTVGDLLKRRGLVKERARRMKPEHPKKPLIHVRQPNQLWCADFKGHFALGNGRRCNPLTITDAHSRYLLCCRAVGDTTTTEDVQPLFERVFREYGLPRAMRTDNGPPFASTGLARLSRLSVCWVKLGIHLERIDPGRPDQNGRHERMHKTLKEEATIPPSHSNIGQQRRFDSFQEEFNHERPHEALRGRTPAMVYEPSTRKYPEKLAEIEYPKHYSVRMVRTDGTFKWKGTHIYCSEALIGEPLGLEEIADGRWLVCFSTITLAILDDRRSPCLLRVG
jgi:transposase InsO family protein